MSDAYQDEDYPKRLKSLTHLAELCVELLRQNDEHYADVCIIVYLPACLSLSWVLMLLFAKYAHLCSADI